MQQLSGWLTATEAAQRLGVKPATLYAYVSRGVLSRRRSPTGQSLFNPDEVEGLARRGRPRRPAGASEVVIESRITALGPDHPYYRGRDALDLALAQPFEAVAEWLWTGDPEVLARPGVPWRVPRAARTAGLAAQAALPPDVLPLERLHVIVPALAAVDPLRSTLDPPAVMDVGRSLIAGMVECLAGSGTAAAIATGTGTATATGTGTGTGTGGTIADRLWVALTGTAPTALTGALRAALVLLADHELAASTLAVRVAASVRADPYAAVLAGLGTTSGALHGGASLGAEIMFAEADSPADAHRLVGLRMRRGVRIPGFGHSVYRGADGRGALLMDMVRAGAPEHGKVAVADAVLAEAERRRLPAPNVDLALATLTTVAGMPTGSGEAIFAVARTAGWLAHAMEEYERRTPLRLRSVYIGPDYD